MYESAIFSIKLIDFNLKALNDYKKLCYLIYSIL